MRKNEKGFTLIELLAVIIILGLLMAIAIPSVSRYITQSRKKTVIDSINGYVNAATTMMNDPDLRPDFYKPADATDFKTPAGKTPVNALSKSTLYFIPVGCIDLEKGGKNPFGDWDTGSGVLVSYDGSKFQYGFQFKDTGGYTMNAKEFNAIKKSGDDLQTDNTDWDTDGNAIAATNHSVTGFVDATGAQKTFTAVVTATCQKPFDTTA